jgi:uncharacterized protein YmfQ (DUF2313 family)
MTHSELLKRLLPPESYSPNAPLISAELAAEGNALDFAQGYADQILLESDPRTAVVTLSDWERVYGLPEPEIVAAGISQSVQERRAALVAKVNLEGGQDIPFFINLAAALGYAITITECQPHTTEHDTEHPVYDEQYRFVWYVNAALVTLRESTTEDDTEMPTAVWGNALLEAAIRRYKPAHTHVLFSYA